MPNLIILLTAAVLLFVPGPTHADNDRLLAGVRRIVFLGDSITYSGQYVEYLEAYLRTSQPVDHSPNPRLFSLAQFTGVVGGIVD
jgi:phospholipase/lecithinase/hemolysin